MTVMKSALLCFAWGGGAADEPQHPPRKKKQSPFRYIEVAKCRDHILPSLRRPPHDCFVRRAHELDDATRALEREFVQELRDLEVRGRNRPLFLPRNV